MYHRATLFLPYEVAFMFLHRACALGICHMWKLAHLGHRHCKVPGNCLNCLVLAAAYIDTAAYRRKYIDRRGVGPPQPKNDISNSLSVHHISCVRVCAPFASFELPYAGVSLSCLSYTISGSYSIVSRGSARGSTRTIRRRDTYKTLWGTTL